MRVGPQRTRGSNSQAAHPNDQLGLICLGRLDVPRELLDLLPCSAAPGAIRRMVGVGLVLEDTHQNMTGEDAQTPRT